MTEWFESIREKIRFSDLDEAEAMLLGAVIVHGADADIERHLTFVRDVRTGTSSLRDMPPLPEREAVTRRAAPAVSEDAFGGPKRGIVNISRRQVAPTPGARRMFGRRSEADVPDEIPETPEIAVADVPVSPASTRPFGRSSQSDAPTPAGRRPLPARAMVRRTLKVPTSESSVRTPVSQPLEAKAREALGFVVAKAGVAIDRSVALRLFGTAEPALAEIEDDDREAAAPLAPPQKVFTWQVSGRMQQARTLLKAGEYQAAAELFGQSAGHGPSRAEARSLQAEAYAALDDVAEMNLAIRDLARVDAEAAIGWLHRLETDGRLEAAFSLMNGLIEDGGAQSPPLAAGIAATLDHIFKAADDPVAQPTRLRAFALSGRLGDAALIAQQVKQLFQMVWARGQDDDPRANVPILAAIAAVQPGNGKAWRHLAFAYDRLQEGAASSDAWIACVATGEFEDAVDKAVRSALKIEDPVDSLQRLARIAALAPRDDNLLARGHTAFERLARSAREVMEAHTGALPMASLAALYRWADATAADGERSEVRQETLQRLEGAVLFEAYRLRRTGAVDEALRVARDLLEAGSTSISAVGLLADAAYELDDVALARDAYLSLLERQALTAAGFERLLDCLNALGETEAARACCVGAVEDETIGAVARAALALHDDVSRI